MASELTHGLSNPCEGKGPDAANDHLAHNPDHNAVCDHRIKYAKPNNLKHLKAFAKAQSLTIFEPPLIVAPIMVTASTSKGSRAAKVQDKRQFRTYDSAMRYLFSMTDYEQMLRVRYNRDTFSLERMFRILKGLDNPHEKIRTVHIAGTKGKGSTVEMLSRMLIACGYRVGVYTSPHIMDIRERIRINDDIISQAAVTRLICEIEPVINSMTDARPTFFELFTAMAFQYFAVEGVDVAVIETGLGGRLDSTNVVKPEACGLTSISMDHMQQLGPTLDKIAEEKAGIFKEGVPAISVPQRRRLRRYSNESPATPAAAHDRGQGPGFQLSL